MDSTTDNLKTVIVTGASNGLGLESVKKFAKDFPNYRIIMACRNIPKATSLKESIEKETNHKNLIVMEIDTSSLASVQNFVKNYKNSSYGKIYGLICNAGIGGFCKGLSKGGYDIIFATNHLGHFLLVNSLLPCFEENGRILIISSDMHDPPEEFKKEKYEWLGGEKYAKPDENLANSNI